MTETIVAPATPAGRGALGVVRVSGPGARRVAREVLDWDALPAARQGIEDRVVVGAERPVRIVHGGGQFRCAQTRSMTRQISSIAAVRVLDLRQTAPMTRDGWSQSSLKKNWPRS